jgi:hypothetical protein
MIVETTYSWTWYQLLETAASVRGHIYYLLNNLKNKFKVFRPWIPDFYVALCCNRRSKKQNKNACHRNTYVGTLAFDLKYLFIKKSTYTTPWNDC